MEKEIQKHLRKIYQALKNNRLEIHYIKLERKVYGWYYVGFDNIEIDPLKSPLVTLIHEILHYIYPNINEKGILKLERKICNEMSDRQWVNFIKLVGKNGNKCKK